MSNHEDDDGQPYLPYDDAKTGKSSGWSGSEASQERAEHDDLSGRTTIRQRYVLSAIGDTRYEGLTWRELASLSGMHHGQASGVLSNLHAGGRVERLTTKRGRCHPYVLPEFVGDRETAPFGGKGSPTRAEIWDAGFYAGIQFEGEDATELPPNPYR